MRLRRFSTHYLDLELSGDPQVDIRIVERPGVWMTPAQLDALLADLRAVVAESVPGGTLDYGVFTGAPERLRQAIVTILYDKESRQPVAFNALALLPVTVAGRDEEVLHFGLAMVSPHYRGRGLAWALYGLTVMLMFAHRQLRPMWISNVTQVPSVFGLVSDSLANVYPSARPGSRRSFTHLAIARQIMQRHRDVFGAGPTAGFDADRFVITAGYTTGSRNLMKRFDDAPRHRNDLYNDYCQSGLDYARGDDFLQLGQYTVGVARDYLLRFAPRHSLPSLLYTAAFLLAGSLLLPVLHWFAASTTMNDLRPWRTRLT